MIVENVDLQERIWRLATQLESDGKAKREGKQWLPHEDELLLRLVKEKRQIEAIAVVLERNVDAVKQRVYILQKKMPGTSGVQVDGPTLI